MRIIRMLAATARATSLTYQIAITGLLLVHLVKLTRKKIIHLFLTRLTHLMRIRDAAGIYNVLENRLRKSATPLTCVELYDDLDVQKFADTPSRVSDYLGHMYRQGLLSRHTAPKTANSQARYAYSWKNQDELIKPTTKPPAPEPQQQPPAAVTMPRTVLSKPSITISDDGETVLIDLPALTITIRSKR